jgi:sugar phosphate isomerase/epimerase
VKLGLGSYAYAWAIGIAGHPPANPMTALQLVQRATALGLHVVQIADNLPLGAMIEAELQQLAEVSTHHSIAIEVGTRGIAPDHLAKYLELAVRFGSPILRVVIDTATHHPAPDEVIKTLREVLPSFEHNKVTLAVENHDRFKVRTLIDILRAVDSPWLGICLDTVNSLGAGEGAEVVVQGLAPYVINVHVKDYTIRRHPTMLGFEVQGTPAGQGMLDVAWLIEQVRSYGRDPNMILELWPPPEAALADTIAKEDQWVMESLAYLKTLIPTWSADA